ncbi:zinc finger protein 131-like [Tribolium madens]|uniref:zinc finger protein 131-like n=1 Tax=Tribolium madens TaxID=41895 RepID=UPI001CF7614B|nr:zinc finger protein 131-like [Tribolium madens]
MALADDQQFCLRWNNFQANITSQFEALRDDEDFTDVTIACEGQRMQAHKVVLSACSPFFKELFKTNPCSHPIIFMRDVEARHIVALMEFMYAGEVNVAQAHLSAFLKTAESLKIRGLTDTSAENETQNTLYLNPQSKTAPLKHKVSSSSTVTSSQDVSTLSSPPPKRQCKSEGVKIKEDAINPFALQEPKVELPDYLSDEGDVTEFPGGMEIIPQVSNFVKEPPSQDSPQAPLRLRRRRSSDWPEEKGDRRNRLVKLGEGIEIYEDQLRSVKWNDYRKLTRGLATILFSPAELATCSVTGQRWSRAGSGERPVKPALDRSKVQAIISYVATRFPMVEISRIKQVLAYKCKENSTAFKMKAVRYYEDQHQK